MTSTARVWPGEPYPLGASWDGRGVNFALFSAHAEKVELCLFDQSGRHEIERIPLPEQTDQVWHGYLPEAQPGIVYAYRVYGPYQPENGHRFNHHKLLLDPYAKQLTGTLQWTTAHYGYRSDIPEADLSFDRRDNAHYMPKCVVVDDAFSWDDDHPPHVAWPDTVIYETHLRGFTIAHPALPKPLQGTCAGFGASESVDYLKSLGITAVELLPVHAFIDDHFLVKKDLRNYWGYNTLGFFAPAPRYLSTGELQEFKIMVQRLHDAGIEVLLDVVYNHTAEGNELGPTLCFRGIDNASYYRLRPDYPRYYINHSGCGNTLDLNHPRVLQLVMDSLRYWVTEMHVDGFRFDLTVALAREEHGFEAGSAFLDAVRQDPVLNRVKLIAEPWDIGPDGYQLGRFPGGWAEWNDRFRDTVRRFWRGDEGQLPELARRLHGSSDLFEHNGRRPHASINFITSHDGFTLTDLVSYKERHNQANGEANHDGHHANFSDNYGVEGPSKDIAIQVIRERQKRNLLATVLLAQGTPMLLAGDELGRSQHGNNNAYCQDNEISWLDWSLLEKEQDLFDFACRLLQLRRDYPVLRRNYFVHGEVITSSTQFANIQWLHPEGGLMREADWHNPQLRCLGMLLADNMTAPPTALSSQKDASIILIILNALTEKVLFNLPKSADKWRCLLTTATPSKHSQSVSSTSIKIGGQTVSVFELQQTHG